MSEASTLPARGAVFWPVGAGDSSTIVIDEDTVLQVDLHDLAKAQDPDTPETPVNDQLIAALPVRDGTPYLACFALTHADKDHCLGFQDLLERVTIGEIWATPRLWREQLEDDPDALCPDAEKFREETRRRVDATLAALAEGREPASGDRIRVIGYDTDHDQHAYNELPDEYLAWPGQALTTLNGVDFAGSFEAFIHAPFQDDAAGARNETSLALQITLTDPAGPDAKILLFGDLSHDTLMKIFNYSEYHQRTQYLEWDLLLAPHHCSKYTMYVAVDGELELQDDILEAFQRHARTGSTIVSSSTEIPATDIPGHNPPHRIAADRFQEIVDTFIVTATWGDASAPSPVVLGVDADGAAILPAAALEVADEEARVELSAGRAGGRLAAVTSAAVRIAKSLPAVPAASSTVTGAARVDAAVAADRGGSRAPDTPVGFGR